MEEERKIIKFEDLGFSLKLSVILILIQGALFLVMIFLYVFVIATSLS